MYLHVAYCLLYVKENCDIVKINNHFHVYNTKLGMIPGFFALNTVCQETNLNTLVLCYLTNFLPCYEPSV